MEIKYFQKDFEEAIITQLHNNKSVDDFEFICGHYPCENCYLNDSENCYNDVQQLINTVIRKEKLKKLLKE